MGDSNRQKVDQESLAAVQPALEELEKFDGEVEKLIDEFEVEQSKLMWQLEQKKAPVLLKRKDAIAKIPNFWFTVLSHHQTFSALIEGEDEDLLKYLTDVTVEQKGGDVMTDAKIVFTFKANPYFENKELIRDYHFVNEELTVRDIPAINWKDGKRLTGAKPTKGKKRGHDEVIDSFFNWFDKQIEVPEDHVKQLGVTFIEEVWPNAYKYYLNDDVHAPVFGDGDFDDQEDGEDDEDEE